MDGEDPEDVIPSRVARRWARWGLGIVLCAWMAFDTVLGLLVRTHHLDAGSTAYSMGAGVIACLVVFPVYYGSNFRARLVISGSQRFVTANTLTGPRAIDLGALVSVRRFPIPSRYGGSGWDELRLRDSHGVRLAITTCESTVDDAIFAAAEANGARLSRLARQRLTRRYWVPRDAGGKFLAFLTVVCCVEACLLVSGFITSLISGTPLS